MKTIAYTALHYGSEYLAWAIRSIIDHVDEYWVLYASKGSHGHHTDARCPDSRELLLSLASEAAGAKLRWVDGEWAHEGYQRDTIHRLVPDADVILVLDTDEIWPEYLARFGPDVMAGWLNGTGDHTPKVNMWRLPMIHYWRSFHRAVLHDLAFPTRIIFPKMPVGEMTHSAHHMHKPSPERGTTIVPGFFTSPIGRLSINHMGYAQRPVTVGYKQYVHGHRNEWRQDIDWFRDRYLANAQADCHPVNVNYWNPEAVQPLDYMPSWMTEHPYFGLEVIK